MSDYRLDRTQFEAFKAEERESDYGFWVRYGIAERLKAAFYLTCSSYGIDPEDFPKMDKSHFEMVKQN